MSMAKRDHLTATPTVDKNGKATTVYRRNGQGQMDSRSFPSPVVTAPAIDRVELNRRVSLELLSGSDHEAATRRDIVTSLGEFSDEVIIKIDELLNSTDGENREQLAAKIRMNIVRYWRFESGFEERMMDALHFYPLFPERSFNMAERIIRSLREYPQLPETKSFTDASDDLMAKYVALARTIDAALASANGKAMFQNKGSVFVFADDKLTELVLDYPEYSEQITAVIRERNTLDSELLRMVIRGEAPAVGNGTL